MKERKRRIILSRKGFDSTCGFIPSPIIGSDLISMPIPEENISEESAQILSYNDLIYKDTDYRSILNDLAPKRKYNYCHMDPDLSCDNRRIPIKGWKPAFGQSDGAQTLLNECNVEPGDIFLFFGWFRKAEKDDVGHYRYVSHQSGDFYDHSDLHVVYGYMEIGKIVTDRETIDQYQWHPHSSPYYLNKRTNTLYLPAEKLSILPERDGYGLLSFSTKRVLTKKGRCRSIWGDMRLGPYNLIKKRKNSGDEDAIYYKGQWQELVYERTDEIEEYVKEIISDDECSRVNDENK